MVKLILKSISFTLLLGGLCLGLALALSYYPQRHHYEPGSTSASLFMLKEPRHYDYVVLGASHARSLLKQANYQIVANTLDGSIADLSHGGGAGIVPMSVMVDYFFTTGNTCSKALYFIDSQSFYMRELNENHDFLEKEPINFTLLRLALEYGMDGNRIASYFQSKFRPQWINSMPNALSPIVDSVTTIDPHKVKLRWQNMFPDTLEEDMANHYVNRLDDLIDLLHQNHCEVVFIVPPTLLGVLPGDAFLLALLETKRAENGIEYLNLSQAILEHHLYEDLDHLNTKGTMVLMENYLKPFMDKLNNGRELN